MGQEEGEERRREKQKDRERKTEYRQEKENGGRKSKETRKILEKESFLPNFYLCSLLQYVGHHLMDGEVLF